MKLQRHLSPWAVLSLALVDTAVCADDGWTAKHEPGRCAMRGHCGKDGWFGSELPCPDNGPPEELEDEVRQKLVDICGDKWSNGPVCCTEYQIDGLTENLNKANNLISSCPACKSNFFDLFCTFTCSPDQSLFVNVTQIAPSGDKSQVRELDNLWSDKFGSGFYNSCKDVKFGPTNAKVMSLIGGGAKNYTDFLHFLGKKQFGGSPFQINFPRPSKDKFPGMEASDITAHPCNSTDEKYRCACLDCETSCTEAPPITTSHQCHVGVLPCLSFAVILIYSIGMALLMAAVTGHVAYKKHAQNQHERMRLLQDTSLSDDEDDEGEVVYQPGILSRPSRRYFINTVCDAVFSRLGRICARYPAIVISTSVILVGLLSLGWLRFAIETDPVRLWVAPDSAAAQEKMFFDENFGPFFRAEQAFLVNDTTAGVAGTVLSTETLLWWADVESQVRRFKSIKGGHTFDDVCYKPTGDTCVVQSVLRYWDNLEGFDPSGWEETLEKCADEPVSCRPAFGQPMPPTIILGGYNQSVLEAEAMVTTWVVKNYQEGTSDVERAMDWEDSLKGLLRSFQDEAKERGLRLSFTTEISLEQELNKSSNTDAKIVVISYIIMFLYASLALGSTTLSVRNNLRNPSSALVQSKFMLGVMGILIVLLSVSASVGLFSAAGVKVTLIIAEVIPFLVLAVGVDNIFLIVHEFERVNSSHPDSLIEDRMAKALGRMGPSILLSATMETVAFALGCFVGMPAVRNFAAYAAGAVLINALLQVTMFVSTLALNQRRVESQRVDCFPCIRVRGSSVIFDGNMAYASAEEDSLQRFIRRTYAPALLGKKVKVAVIAVFAGLLTAGLALLPAIKLGLDQRIALPSDSYLIEYFNDLAEYFDTGPPVYFVTRELNATELEHQKVLCGRFATCDQYSLANLLEAERKRPEVSYIADPAASWVDDFFLWLNPESKDCCVDPTTNKPCLANRDPPYNLRLKGMPEGREYIDYLQLFLDQIPDEKCPLAGKAAYGDAVVYSNTSITTYASHFRTSHTPLRTQEDFIAAYASARRIASEVEARNPGLSVFPYSKFYVFFDPYASIVRLTLALLGSAVAVCFLISAVLLGSIRTGLVVSITVIMTLVNIGGAMAVANVSLNPLTLVNLVICVGIAVEFCAHIARAFQFPSARLLDRSTFAFSSTAPPSAAAPAGYRTAANKITVGDGPNGVATLRGKDARAWAALTQVGSSVFSGITVTKLLGVCVLAFTRSKIFEVYYFRVWLALVIFAALHALVFLPVALSLFGGDGEFLSFILLPHPISSGYT